MKRKLIYLINPISGTKKKPKLKEIIHARTTAAGFDYDIEETRADGNYSALRSRVIKEKITDIIVCGGDGSISAVSAYLLDIDVAVGIVPMGSGNGLALAAGIPYATTRALDIIFKGYSSYIDGFYINDKFSCMMCGIGADAQVAHDFARKKTRGLKTYLQLSAWHYFKSKPFKFIVNTPDKIFNTDAFFICVANSNQFGNHVTIAPRASLSDGLLDIVVVKKMHKLMLPFALLNQIAGINALQEMNNYKKNRNIIYFQSAEATIINDDNALLHIDGEPAAASKHIAIRIRPRAFRLLQPPL